MACTTLAKVVLLLLNIFIGILAFLLIAIGAVFEFGRTLFEQYALPQLEQLLSGMGNAGASFQITSEDWDTIMNAIHTVAIPLMITGCVIFFITFCACCGVCCGSKNLLLVYSIIISVITIIFICGGIWVYVRKDQYIEQLEPEMQTWLRREYVNETATDICSLAINFLNIFGECCGIVNSQDFDDYPKTFTVTINGFTIPGDQVIPATCCKDITIENPVPVDLTCATAPTDVNTNMNKGCYRDFIMPYFTSYSNYVMYGGIAFLVVMGIITIFAWMVCCSYNQANKRVSVV